MENLLQNLPTNPTLGFIALFVISGIIYLIHAKITGNNNTNSNNTQNINIDNSKQSGNHIGSNNIFYNSSINQKTSDDKVNHKD